MRILDYNHCLNKSCSCGWNIHLGGVSEKELQELRQFLGGRIEKDLTDYGKKISTEKFGTFIDKLTT